MRILTAILLLLAALSTGCATLDGWLTNRVTITTALDECQFSSRWGGMSIGADIDKRDCEAIRQGMLLRILMLLQQQQRGGS